MSRTGPLAGPRPRMRNDENWRDHAACAGTPTGWWFPEGVGTSADPRALNTCRHCPVTAECLTYALATPETHGIWGGKTPAQLRILRRDQ